MKQKPSLLYNPIPPVPGLDPLPYPYPQPNNKWLIIGLSAMLFVFALFYIVNYQWFISEPPMRITCNCGSNYTCNTQLSPATMVANNIQASHTYDLWSDKHVMYMLPSNKSNGMHCLGGIDDWGELSGSSMQPTFFEGNTVLLKNFTSNTTLRTGDMIRYFRFNAKYPDCITMRNLTGNMLGGSWVNNSMAVIHRINAVYDDEIVVQGDNLREVEVIHKCQVTDVVVGILFT